MKVDVQRTERQAGLIFKKTEFVAEVKAILDESERAIVNQLYQQRVQIPSILFHTTKRGSIDCDLVQRIGINMKKKDGNVLSSTCVVDDNQTREGFIETIKDSFIELKQRMDALQSANDAPDAESFEL